MISWLLKLSSCSADVDTQNLQFRLHGRVSKRSLSAALPSRRVFFMDSNPINMTVADLSVYQVLTALDNAQRELGFVHGDMRIANIMEHRPRDDAEAGDNEFVPRGYKTDGKLQSADEFKLPGGVSIIVHLNLPMPAGSRFMAMTSEIDDSTYSKSPRVRMILAARIFRAGCQCFDVAGY